MKLFNTEVKVKFLKQDVIVPVAIEYKTDGQIDEYLEKTNSHLKAMLDYYENQINLANDNEQQFHMSVEIKPHLYEVNYRTIRGFNKPFMIDVKTGFHQKGNIVSIEVENVNIKDIARVASSFSELMKHE